MALQDVLSDLANTYAVVRYAKLGVPYPGQVANPELQAALSAPPNPVAPPPPPPSVPEPGVAIPTWAPWALAGVLGLVVLIGWRR